MVNRIFAQAVLAMSLSWCIAAHGREPPDLEQETISIQGNRAVPNTIYIQPWKRIGEPLGSHRLEGRIREDTDPLEREVFRRELQLERHGYSIE